MHADRVADTLRMVCAEQGWDFDAVNAYQERLRADMRREAAALSEGICPRCNGRLTPTERVGYVGWCAVCDTYPHVRYFDDGEVSGVGAASGWFVRGER